jgi:opacity protein-like surface antigen
MICPKMKTKRFLSALTALLIVSTAAFAQSAGSTQDPDTQIAQPAPIAQAQPIEQPAQAVAPPAGERIYYAGFSGGMMVHTGYITGGKVNLVNEDLEEILDVPIGVSGPPIGIGGAMKIHLGRHVRIGGEGHMSTLNYGSGKGSHRNQSHARIGWGGVLVDYTWRVGKNWTPYAGGLIGGGSFKNLTLLDPTEPDYKLEKYASYRNYSFVVLAPFVGIELALSDRIGLNVKADWMLKLTNRQEDFASGPRLYFGFTFYRWKE